MGLAPAQHGLTRPCLFSNSYAGTDGAECLLLPRLLPGGAAHLLSPELGRRPPGRRPSPSPSPRRRGRSGCSDPNPGDSPGPAPCQLPVPDTVNPPAFPIMYLFGALILCTDMAAHMCVFLEKEKGQKKHKTTTQWKRKNSIPLHFWFFAVLACVLLREPGPRLWGPAPQWNPFQVLARMDGPLGWKGRRVPRAPLEASHRACQVLLAQGFGPRAGHSP